MSHEQKWDRYKKLDPDPPDTRPESEDWEDVKKEEPEYEPGDKDAEAGLQEGWRWD